MPDSAAAAPANGDSSVLAKVMADLGRSHPQYALLAQLMQARASAAPTQPEDLRATDTEEIASLAAELRETRARLDATQRQTRRLLERYQAATEKLADLAAALGACGLCWGEDAACPGCRGRGRAGMVRPDPERRARLLGSARKPAETASPVSQN